MGGAEKWQTCREAGTQSSGSLHRDCQATGRFAQESVSGQQGFAMSRSFGSARSYAPVSDLPFLLVDSSDSSPSWTTAATARGHQELVHLVDSLSESATTDSLSLPAIPSD